FSKIVHDVDAVFETVGGDVVQKSFSVIASAGKDAFIDSGAKAPPSPRDDVTSLRPQVKRSRRHMERIGELYEAGAIRPPEVKLFKLADAVEALRVSEGRHFRGKLVFQIRPETA